VANESANLASEFFVASQLFRLGLGVTLTLGNTKEVDLVVLRPDGTAITIDVKGLKNSTNWPIVPKRREARHFFVLVCWRNRFTDVTVSPDVFVVPSLRIDEVLKPWSGRPEQTGIEYRDVRGGEFQNGWSLLLS
jgi:hypothetical protein